MLTNVRRGVSRPFLLGAPPELHGDDPSPALLRWGGLRAGDFVSVDDRRAQRVDALAVLAARGEQPANSVTLLTTLLDFSDTGEIGLFIDSKCRGGDPLPNPSAPVVSGDHVTVACESKVPLKKAELNYTTDTGLRSKREWKSVPATIKDGIITAPKPPAEANTWFITVSDERDAMVSTVVEFAK